MKKPTLNQRIWQSILAQTEKALAQITKHTGEVFDESVFSMPKPKRITERAISRLQETELKFIKTHIEDVSKSAPQKQVEALKKSVQTHEEYIRHPRMSLSQQEYEPHPLSAEERSERARKAWQTRVSRMTEEQYAEYKKSFSERMREARAEREAQESAEDREARKVKRSEAAKKAWQTRQSAMTDEEKEQYKKDFAERMRKAREAKELDKQGYVAPPEPEEPIPEEDYEEVFGVPLTPEEAEEYYKEQHNLIAESEIIDYSVEEAVRAMYDNPQTFPERIPELEGYMRNAKLQYGERKYYAILQENASVLLDTAEFWLQYKYERRARAEGLHEFVYTLFSSPMSLEEATKYTTDYDTEMQMPD